MKLFERFSAWKRARTLERHAFADEAWEAALAPYQFFDRLDDAERARLRELVSLFCAEKEFAAAGDFEMTLQIQLEVAAQAAPDHLVPGKVANHDRGIAVGKAALTVVVWLGRQCGVNHGCCRHLSLASGPCQASIEYSVTGSCLPATVTVS